MPNAHNIGVAAKRRILRASARGSAALSREIASLRREAAPIEAIALVGIIENAARRLSTRFLPDRCESFNEMFARLLAPPIELGKEFAWACAIVQRARSLIEASLVARREAEEAVLKGCFDQALATLTSHEGTVGQSIWLMEVRMALLQASSGIKAQKSYLESLSQAASQSFGYIIAWLISYRNEEQVSLAGFESRVSNVITRAHVPNWLTSHFNSSPSLICSSTIRCCGEIDSKPQSR
jgi:hypothetical protein